MSRNRMKTLIPLAIAAFATLNALATQYQDIDALGGVTLGAGGSLSLSGTFDIAGPADTSGVTIGAPYGTPTTYSDITGFSGGNLANAWVLLYVQGSGVAALQVGPGFLASGFQNTYSIFGGTVNLASLNQNGTLAYTVSALGGSFTVDYAALVATTDANSGGGLVASPAGGVPDGGSTVLLLGSSLLGLAALRRKLGL